MRDRPGRTAGRLVLAVDDSPDVIVMVGRVAKSAGFHFLSADSGLACLSLTLRCIPRLILLDVEMPSMSGYETCRRLRENPALAHVPIALLTARRTVEDISEGLAAGGNDVIGKPFRPAHLLERIQHWTSRQI